MTLPADAPAPGYHQAPWQMSTDTFERHLPDDVAACTADRFARHLATLRAQGVPEERITPYLEAPRDALTAQWEAAIPFTREAHAAAVDIRDRLATAWGAEVRVGGSFAHGQFYERGVRAADLDLVVAGLDVPRGAKDRQSLSPLLKPALRTARKAAVQAGFTVLDPFVEHDGRLWVLNAQNQLDRRDGHVRRVTRIVPGVGRVGDHVTMADFAARFRHELDTHPRLVQAAVAAGLPVPDAVRRDEAVDRWAAATTGRPAPLLVTPAAGPTPVLTPARPSRCARTVSGR